MVEDVIPHNSFRFLIEQTAHIGECKRFLNNFSSHPAFSNKMISDSQLIISEYGSNLVKYANRGEIQIKLNVEQQQIEIISLDNGPGMESVSHMLKDGNSTGGTLGHGLGAIRRLSSWFDYYSQPDHGSFFISIVCEEHLKPKTMNTTLCHEICVPIKGEFGSGDWVSTIEHEDCIYFISLDGLGHGPQAAIVATSVGNAFNENFQMPLLKLWDLLNDTARNTRGGAVGFGKVDLLESKVQFVGLGNIQASVMEYGKKTHHLISKPGILGKSNKIPSLQTCPFNKNSTLIAYSDGLKSITNNNFPTSLFGESPATFNAYLLKIMCGTLMMPPF